MEYIEKILEVLESAAVDIRVPDGIFDISNQENIEILREYLLRENFDVDFVSEYLNNVLEGKFPDRQAYNANGLLVTFPTPEYKQRALKRGTHFEKNPKAVQSNLFSDSPEKPHASAPATTSAPIATAQPSVPASTSATEPTPTPTPTIPPPPTDNITSDPKNRTPEERASDAKVVDKMLRDT